MDICVIGAGAAGLAAAIRASQCGGQVLLIDHMPRAGKKILATGGGRCNISNSTLNAGNYNTRSRELVGCCLERLGSDDVTAFFRSLGLFLREEEGRLYPVTNQASTVLTALEMACDLEYVDRAFNTTITKVTKTPDGFMLTSPESEICCQQLVIATGGRTYPALGSDGSGYALAESLGHSLITPIPTCVPLMCRHPLLHPCQGLKLQAEVTVLNGDTAVQSLSGDLLFTKYGLSGTAILDASDIVCEALHRSRGAGIWLEVDFAPFISEDELRHELNTRAKWPESPELEVNGIIPIRLAAALATQPNRPFWIDAIKHSRFYITDTRGWNEAEFTNGGVRCNEVTSDLASRCCDGLYLAGEVLDVHGERGGYNLAWAWISGLIAGESCVKSGKNTGIM
ncbi:MAG: aminoacetone oxidase family FAD-binding enzyme [Armatimonadota bacterium]